MHHLLLLRRLASSLHQTARTLLLSQATSQHTWHVPRRVVRALNRLSSVRQLHTAVAQHLRVTPVRCNEPKSTWARDIARMVRLAGPERRLLVAAFGFLVFSSAVSLSVPFGMGKIIDTVVGAEDQDTLNDRYVHPRLSPRDDS